MRVRLAYRFVGTLVLLALGSLELMAGDSTANSVNEAIHNQSCGFWKQMDHADPEELAAEFVKKDSEGEFMMMRPWFDTATLCPHREQIPDHAFVVKNPRLVRVSQTPSAEEFEVTYQQVGILTSLSGNDQGRMGFAPNVGEKKRKFVIVKTAYGWRLVNPVLKEGQFISARTVLHDGRIRPEDRKILEQLGQ